MAGQLDSTLLDDGYDRASLAETEANIRRLQRGASDKVNELVKQRRERGQERLAEVLTQLAEPVFASTFAYGFGNWPEEKWGNSMRHTHGQLQEMAEECWDPLPAQWFAVGQLRCADGSLSAGAPGSRATA